MNNGASYISGTTKATSKTRVKTLSEMKKMSKLQVLNHFKDLYDNSEPYLKSRFEKLDPDFFSNHKIRKRAYHQNKPRKL